MDDELQRNQPPTAIPGGPRRVSVRVAAGRFPAIAERERVEALLRAHDPADAREALASLRASDLPIVRLIAAEGAAAGAEPAVRYAALAALGAHPSRENLNLLADLAQLGEDFYVRGHALLALGQTGLLAHVPILASRLASDEPFERIAAERGLQALAAASSSDAVHAHAALLLGAKRRKRVDDVLAQAPAGKRAGGRKPRETTAERAPEAPDRDAPA